MPQRIIRPTMKFIYLGYLATVVIVAALVVGLMSVQWPPTIAPSLQTWIPWLPVLLLLWPLRRHLRNRATKITIHDFELPYETGLLSRTTRTIMLPRMQDVTVHQRIGQRIFGVGDVSIETAGEAGRLTIFQIDRPQEIADLINERSREQFPIDRHA